ncbi:hypothetical protein [Butyricicoccus porcorum]|uniref:hypothetical protein n=1 Tax=Butyricicoccus porcorum TaxID=1945634 RepID=UPI001056CEA0|nr:hypothetical protein [Butyricicoccus porcorum]
MIISEAAEAIRTAEVGEHIDQRLAPPDLFNRRQETGRSAIDIFADAGLYFDRAMGNAWRAGMPSRNTCARSTMSRGSAPQS